MDYHGEDEIPERLLEALAKAPVVPEWEIDHYVRDRAYYPEPTDRELEVLQAASHGLEYTMIADALGISAQTVQSYLKRVRYTLKAKNTCHAVAIALRKGLIV